MVETDLTTLSQTMEPVLHVERFAVVREVEGMTVDVLLVKMREALRVGNSDTMITAGHHCHRFVECDRWGDARQVPKVLFHA